jgi:hypothetical protein
VKATFLKGVVLGSVVSIAMLTATAAFAGSGVGAIFNLGQTNAVNAQTKLTGATDAGQLAVVNTSTGATATGIGIAVANGKPPLAVNSTVKVSKLNADLVDGLDSTELQKRVSPSCSNGTAITKIGPNGGVACSTSTIISLHRFPASGSTAIVHLDPSGLEVGLVCHVSGSFYLAVEPLSEAGSLNWMFSEGGTASTVNASGTSLVSHQLGSFSPPGTRLEGQWIWADADYSVTMNVHVFDAGTGCEMSGTAEVAKT